MHPIERLRYVARAGSADAGVLVREAAGALAGMGTDGPGLVLACKRLVERHTAAGPMWSLCARVLCAGEARREAYRMADEIDGDATARHLVDGLPEEARITIVGWPELVAEALPRRGDLEVLVVDAGGEGAQLARRLVRVDVDASEVPEAGTAAAAAASAVVVLEASAMGPGGFVAPAGSRAAAATAYTAHVPVWLVAGVGRALPGPLWETVVARLADDEPWGADVEVVPLDLVDVVVGPTGQLTPAEARARADCPVATELVDR